MSVTASHVRFPLDAARSYLLRTSDEGQDTATGYTACGRSCAIDRAAAYWADDEIVTANYAVQINVTSINLTGDATYALIVSSQVSNGGAPTELARVPLTSVGQFSVSVDASQFGADAKYLTCGVEIAGSPNGINYDAEISFVTTE